MTYALKLYSQRTTHGKWTMVIENNMANRWEVGTMAARSSALLPGSVVSQSPCIINL